MSLFGNTGATGGGSMFGAAQNSTSNLFGGAGAFGGANNNAQATATTQPSTTTGTLFGGGSTVPVSQTEAKLNSFGLTATQPAASTTAGGLFGGQQQQQPTSNALPQASQPHSSRQNDISNLFASLAGQPQEQSKVASVLGQIDSSQIPQLNALLLQASMMGQKNPLLQLIPQPGEKSIPEQIQILAEKWLPTSSSCVFQHYFYNQVPPEHVPFFVPGPNEDPRQWEEALSKKPNEGAIPVLAKGFGDISQRLEVQFAAVRQLQQRLHEVNNSLDQIIQKHDLDFSSRVAECRRRNLAITQRSLALATKVQTLRNRGYSLDASEEELKKRLHTLEKSAFDPAITGRQDEIWARMAGLRARAQVIKEENDRRNTKNNDPETPLLDEKSQKEVTKLLQNYDTQLEHVRKELSNITSDYGGWSKAVGYDPKREEKNKSRKH